MNRLILTLAVVSMAGIAQPLLADAIPYPNKGTVAPSTAVTATTNGIVAYFAGSNAKLDDSIEVIDTTSGFDSGLFFPNHASTLGDSITIGAGAGEISVGDNLVFLVSTSAGDLLSSVAANNSDLINHVYITPFSGGDLNGATGLPAGLYVGFEDEPLNFPSDLDYNDDSFVFAGVSGSTVTPEPSSIALLGTGMLAMAGSLRRRFSSR